MDDCLFCSIVAGKIPCSKIYEDDDFFAFLDISPVHKGHALVIPKKHIRDVLDIDDVIGRGYMNVISKISKSVVKAVDADGCNIVSNAGAAAGQQVFHVHFHIIPRFEGDGLKHWPKGDEYSDREMDEFAEKISALIE